MNLKEIENIIEALLFLTGEAIEFKKLAKFFDINERDMKPVLESFSERFNQRETALSVIFLDESVQIITKPEYGAYIAKYKAGEIREKKILSKSGLEILSIVAYNEPVTKSYIEQIRGVDSSYMLGILIEREFVEERGKLDAPGRPILYGTTKKFLRSFGLESLEDLPDKEKFKTLIE